jgi:hypothetical protein
MCPALAGEANAQVLMSGAVAHPQDLRSGHLEKGRGHRAGDLQVYLDRMVGDLSVVYPDRKGEEGLLQAYPGDVGQSCQAGFENTLS